MQALKRISAQGLRRSRRRSTHANGQVTLLADTVVSLSVTVAACDARDVH